MTKRARATGATYVERLLTELGQQDPMKILPETPRKLEHAVAGLSDAAVRKPEAPGKWSVLHVVQHLADSELVCGYRMRMIVSHPTPEIQGFDQDLWAGELGYEERKPAEALAEFRSLRQSNLQLLGLLGPEKRRRYGHHSERGEESVDKMIKLYAAHDLVHLKQIDRIKAAVR